MANVPCKSSLVKPLSLAFGGGPDAACYWLDVLIIISALVTQTRCLFTRFNASLIDDLASMREHTPPICAVLQTARLIRTLSQLVVGRASQSGGQLFIYMDPIWFNSPVSFEGTRAALKPVSLHRRDCLHKLKQKKTLHLVPRRLINS